MNLFVSLLICADLLTRLSILDVTTFFLQNMYVTLQLAVSKQKSRRCFRSTHSQARPVHLFMVQLDAKSSSLVYFYPDNMFL